MGKRDAVFMFAVLLFVCGALLYLDWLRQGEIENLHARLDTLDRRLHAGTATPAVQSTVERLLHASDDRTLADIAREGA